MKVSSAVRPTPAGSEIPNSGLKASALPSTSARSQAMIEISANSHSAMRAGGR